MDINNIKYSHELWKRKIELERDLKYIEKERKEYQKTCNHIRIYFGYEGAYIKPGDFRLERCLFCGTQELDDSYPLINASTYRSRYKRSVGEQAVIDSNVEIIQRLCIELLRENPSLTESELIEKVEEEIKRDNEENKKEESYLKRLTN